MQYSLTVTEVNRYIKEIISKDLILSNLWVKGEISNFKSHYSGHLYFTLKDEKSLLKCVMFKTQANELKFIPENGMGVIVRGYVSIFERDGQYQLYAEEMQPDGIGSLHIAFEQLKKRLHADGLFETSRKKKIPILPRSIGVVTSLTGAVIRDILNILERRFPNFELKIFPVQVQGETAAAQISRAIRRLNELNCVDVIILARGGGSLEELWPFNEEIVARSIYESAIPVISAVGHETDFTIADFVADLRAPTPSAAAELVLPDKAALKSKISNMDARLRNSLKGIVARNRHRYEKLRDSVAFRQPYNIIYQNRLKLDVLNRYMQKSLLAAKESADARFKMLAGKLDALSPLKILARGYGIVKSLDTGMIVKSVSDIHKGSGIEVGLSDGIIECKVESIRERRKIIL